MDSMIYDPLKEYESKFKSLHSDNTNKYFNDLVKRSEVNVEENRATVNEYLFYKENFKKLKRKLNLWRFLRVLMIISLILIPLVILKITPKIRALREDVKLSDRKANELLDLAHRQMAPLNSLFTDRDALNIIESTIPSVSFAQSFTAKQEADMVINYDFDPRSSMEHSTVDVLAGNYNGNPFLFENKLIHKMGVETYHGQLTIQWTESYTDSNGKRQTRTQTQTLHASVTKPKPYYSTQVVLNYCAQGGPDLSFSRDATHLERKSDKAIDKYVKKGEKKIKKMTDKAIKQNKDFTGMSNSDFEVLFDALDRNNEVQFRTLFTPLAQTNMVELIRSQEGYGDDFNFIKQKRTNKIISQHSQGRPLNLSAHHYKSYSFDEIKESFIFKNVKLFKDVYFDFAPLWAIPIYQEKPVHSLQPVPDYIQKHSYKEYEAFVNSISKKYVVHPSTQTQAIIKAVHVNSYDGIEQISVTAFSYYTVPRIDLVPVYGGDGRWHNVPVPWDEYIPIQAVNNFGIAEESVAKNRNVIGVRNGLYIFN